MQSEKGKHDLLFSGTKGVLRLQHNLKRGDGHYDGSGSNRHSDKWDTLSVREKENASTQKRYKIPKGGKVGITEKVTAKVRSRAGGSPNPHINNSSY